MNQQQIIEAINDMNENDLMQLNNEYCQQINAHDSEIFINDEDFFKTYFDNSDIMRIIQAVFYGDYRYSDNFVTFNGYGNLDSFNYMTLNKLTECVETMSEYIEENFNEFEYLFN